MIVINEIPDYNEDHLAGKLTLVARYGKWRGVKLYEASWACTYLVIAVGTLLQVLPLTTLLAFISLPITLRSIIILQANYEDPLKLAPANLDMIVAYSITALGLIAAYSIQGLIWGSNHLQLLMTLLFLTVFYVPAVIALKQTISRK